MLWLFPSLCVAAYFLIMSLFLIKHTFWNRMYQGHDCWKPYTVSIIWLKLLVYFMKFYYFMSLCHHMHQSKCESITMLTLRSSRLQFLCSSIHFHRSSIQFHRSSIQFLCSLTWLHYNCIFRTILNCFSCILLHLHSFIERIMFLYSEILIIVILSSL